MAKYNFETALKKAMKKSSVIYWQENEGKYTVCDGRWLFSTDHPVALSVLTGIFRKIPEGVCLIADKHGREYRVREADKTTIRVNELMGNERYPVRDTNMILKNDDGKQLHIYKVQEGYAYLNEDFTGLFAGLNIEACSVTGVKPIAFSGFSPAVLGDIEGIVLPVNPNSVEVEFLK